MAQNYSYNSVVPASNNDPSTDQPDMLTNAQSISSIIAQDHVGFNTDGSGWHNQVTFASNNIPASPTSPPVLFTNNVAGLAQLFFYSGNATQSSSQYIATSNGSTFLLGGIILKWGQVTVTGQQTVNFAAAGGGNPGLNVGAFPNACFAVIAQPKSPSAPTVVNDAVTIGAVTASTFVATATQRTNTVSNTVTFYCIAIGY
jgi:hypothetical protein